MKCIECGKELNNYYFGIICVECEQKRIKVRGKGK